MQARQNAAFQSLCFADAFLDEHADRLPRVRDAGARKRLKEVIADIGAFADEQVTGCVEGHHLTGRQRALGRVLVREHMAPISLIAKADLPTIELAAFRMPRGKPTVQRLSLAAAEMKRAAELHADVFIAAGLPHDFIAQLEAAADAFVASSSERTETRARTSGATTGLQLKLAEGRRLVAVLNALVRIALDDDIALLTEWNFLKRVRTHVARASTAKSHEESAAVASVSEGNREATASEESPVLANSPRLLERPRRLPWRSTVSRRASSWAEWWSGAA